MNQPFLSSTVTSRTHVMYLPWDCVGRGGGQIKGGEKWHWKGKENRRRRIKKKKGDQEDYEKTTLREKANNGFYNHIVFNVQFYRVCGSWKWEDYVVLYAVARLLMNTGRRDHMTPVLATGYLSSSE